MNTLSGTFAIGTNAVAQEVGGELIVLDMHTERYLSIDPVGRRIWGLLAEGSTLVRVVEEVSTFYGVDRSRIERDVAAFVAQLHELGLGKLSEP